MKAIASSKGIFFGLNLFKKSIGLLTNWATRPGEPKVNFRRDSRGNSYFRVYDPISGRYCNFTSEKEVRIWLEERYYQSSQ